METRQEKTGCQMSDMMTDVGTGLQYNVFGNMVAQSKLILGSNPTFLSFLCGVCMLSPCVGFQMLQFPPTCSLGETASRCE